MTVNSGGSAQHIKDTCSQNREALLCVWYTGEAYMEAMSVHSQYTSTVRVKVADPATLLAVIRYSPLSLLVCQRNYQHDMHSSILNNKFF